MKSLIISCILLAILVTAAVVISCASINAIDTIESILDRVLSGEDIPLAAAVQEHEILFSLSYHRGEIDHIAELSAAIDSFSAEDKESIDFSILTSELRARLHHMRGLQELSLPYIF